MYINSTSIHPIIIMNKMYENQKHRLSSHSTCVPIRHHDRP
jgi:hypothetical protein